MKTIKVLSIPVLAILLASSFAFVLPVQASPVIRIFVAPAPLGTGHQGGSCRVPGFNSIQAAVSIAPTGSTIYVCPGTYTEQVTIAGKTLTLRGWGAPSTIIRAPATLLPDAFGSLNIVTITSGASVMMSGFTVSGPGPGTCGSISYGIFVSGGAYAKIFSNSIVSIRDNPLSGCQNGGGIRVGKSSSSTTGTAEIYKNRISDYQKGGIVVDGAGSLAVIRANRVIGVGPTAMIAQNGIQVSRGASGTVVGNVVTGNECNAPSCGPDLDNQDGSTGILLYNDVEAPLSVMISGNTVNYNDYGIGQAQTDKVSILSNTLKDNRVANLVLWSSDGDLILSNRLLITQPFAAGVFCSVSSNCHGTVYTLGIDILDGSSANTLYANRDRVTSDGTAILFDSSTTGNLLQHNTLTAGMGGYHGNNAAQDLGTNIISGNN